MGSSNRVGSTWVVFAHRAAFECELVSVVDEAVEDGVGEGWIAKNVMPLLDGYLAGDER